MFRKKSGIIITLLLATILLFTFTTTAFAESKIEATKRFNDQCFTCHDAEGLKTTYNGKTISLYVNAQLYKDSIHGTNSCATCHVGITIYPHQTTKYDRHFVVQVNRQCQRCHQDIDKIYEDSIHGKLNQAGDINTAVCSDCHGVHNIYRPQDQGSQMNGQSQTQTCLGCHDKIGQSYMESYHGKAVSLGSQTAAKCSDCHGKHNILGPGDPKSTVNKDNVPTTCAKCHVKAYKNFAVGIEHWEIKRNGPGTSPIMYWTVKFFTWLVFLTCFALFIIQLLFLKRKLKDSDK